MRIKLNNKWYSVRGIEYYNNNKTEFVGNAGPKEVEDIDFGSDSGYTYKELEQMHVDYACPDSDVQEAMNDYDATIAPLADRISQIEEILRNIILALDIDKQTIIDEQGNDRGQHYVSIKLADLTKKVEKLEHKPQSTVQEAPICEQKSEILDKKYNLFQLFSALAVEDDDSGMMHLHRIEKIEEQLDNLSEYYVNCHEKEVDKAMKEHIETVYDALQSVNHEYQAEKIAQQAMQPIEQHFADASKINWEQRRYEIAKEIFVKYALKSSSDTLEQRVVAAADKLINKLKEQEE